MRVPWGPHLVRDENRVIESPGSRFVSQRPVATSMLTNSGTSLRDQGSHPVFRTSTTCLNYTVSTFVLLQCTPGKHPQNMRRSIITWQSKSAASTQRSATLVHAHARHPKSDRMDSLSPLQISSAKEPSPFSLKSTKVRCPRICLVPRSVVQTSSDHGGAFQCRGIPLLWTCPKLGNMSSMMDEGLQTVGAALLLRKQKGGTYQPPAESVFSIWG